MTGALLLVVLALHTIHRRRLVRMLEIERVRTRIAADLHDDVGANLTRIAILSEVARQRLGTAGGSPDQELTAVASIARESASSMSEIVWAIHPGKDQLSDVVLRMRQLASEMLSSAEIDLDFRSDDAIRATRIPADVRRNIFLVFKEALHNAVRHARAGRIEAHTGGGRARPRPDDNRRRERLPGRRHADRARPGEHEDSHGSVRG